MTKLIPPARYLAVLHGPDRGCCIPIHDGVVVGRASSNAPLTDPQLSRIHAFIKLEGTAAQLHYLPRPRAQFAQRNSSPAVSALVPGMQLRLGSNIFAVRSRLQKLPRPPARLRWWQLFPVIGLIFAFFALSRFWRFSLFQNTRLPAWISRVSPGGTVLEWLLKSAFLILLTVVSVLIFRFLHARIGPPDFAGLLFLNYGNQHYFGVGQQQLGKKGELRLRIGPGRVLRFEPGGNYLICGKFALAQVRLAAAQLRYFYAARICENGSVFTPPAPVQMGHGSSIATASAHHSQTPEWCFHLDYHLPAHHQRCVFLVAEETAQCDANAQAGTAAAPAQVALAAGATNVKRLWWPYLRAPAQAWWQQFCVFIQQETIPRVFELTQPPISTAKSLTAAPVVELGQGAECTLTLDFRQDPHVLIAGTTGAGKSALLRTLILNLAATYPPTQLQLLLVDYKGGDAFAEFAELPQVLDVLTNLAPGATQRALDALEYELERRERNEKHVPLLIVVDEFAELIAAHPHLAQRLQRVAALGRGLGIHLVIATQHPQGCMHADLLANISGRILLRLLTGQDASFLGGDNAASELAPYPGRAIAYLHGTKQEFQVGLITRTQQWFQQAQELADAPANSRDFATAKDAAPWLPQLPYPLTAQQQLVLRSQDWAYLDYPRQRLQLPAKLAARILFLGGPGAGVSTALASATRALMRKEKRSVLLISNRLAGFPADRVFRPNARAALSALRTVAADTLVVIDDADQLVSAIDKRCGPNSGIELLMQLGKRLGSGGVLFLGTHRLLDFSRLTANLVVLPGVDLADQVRLQLREEQRAWLTNPGYALFQGAELLPRQLESVQSVTGLVRAVDPREFSQELAEAKLWGRDLDHVAASLTPTETENETVIGWYGAAATPLHFHHRSPLLLVSQIGSIADSLAEKLVTYSAQLTSPLLQAGDKEFTTRAYRRGENNGNFQPGEIRIGSPFNPDSLTITTTPNASYQPVTIFLDGPAPGLPDEVSHYTQRGMLARPVALINGEVTPFVFHPRFK